MIHGRDNESTALGARAAAACRGETGCLVLTAPPGYGKSVLLDALLRAPACRDTTVLRAHCGEAAGGAGAYAGLRALFAPAGAPAPDRLEPGPGEDSPATFLPGPGDAQRFTLTSAYPVFRRLLGHVLRLTADRPLLLVLDDAHHCDEHSLRWLEFLLRRAAGQPLLVVLARSSGTDPRAPRAWADGYGDDGGDDAMGHARRALFHIARGRLPQAREQAERIAELAGTIGEESRCFVYGVLGALALSARDVHLGSRIVAEAAGRAFAPIPAALLSLLRMAEQAQAGAADTALETALECGRQLECAGWRNPVLFPWRPWAISLSQQLGDHHLARTLAAEECARAREWGAPVAIGRALRLRARADGADDRVDLLREAVATLRDSANELELFMAVRDLGRLLGDGAEGREALREAGELAESCGVPWLAGPVSAEGRPSVPVVRSALTRTESRVASLVVNGLTNQEIAAELQVSARAVEKHLTNSYRKLGITGRRELAAVLQEAGVHAPG
ncbi:AAA family ATPase [Streptomyces sp. NPDC004227]